MSKQKGFTLVELMVAMAIGTVIILGAGQLFLTTFQTFRTVDELSRKQETLVFAVSTLVEAGRKGSITTHYAIDSDRRSSGHYCVLRDKEENNQPIVDLAQIDDATECPALSELNGGDVSHLVTLPIGDCRKNANASCDEITFVISERNKIMSSQGEAP